MINIYDKIELKAINATQSSLEVGAGLPKIP